jgi:hypothetical protein
MAATRIVEEDHGTFGGFAHAHNGYYAGDFSRRETRWPTHPNPHPVAPVPAVPFRRPRAA